MWTSVLGIGFSLVPLVLVLSVADGMIEGITARFIELGTYHLQAVAIDDIQPEAVAQLQTEISAVPGVRLVTPELQGLGLLSSPAARTGVTVRAVDPGVWLLDGELQRYFQFVQGKFDLDESDSILLGESVAKTLKVSPGDEVKLLTTRSMLGKSLIPRITPFRSTGIFKTGYHDLDSMWVYIPLEQGRRILSGESSRSLLGIKITDPFGSISEAYANIRKVLPDGWRLYTWFDLERSQYMSFKTTKALLVFIMALILVVAAVNISSSLVMLVIEKQQEIAFLKSIGAHPSQITGAFVWAGFFTGLFGAIFGTALGALISLKINEIIVFLELVLNRFGEITILNPDFYLEKIPVKPAPLQLLSVGIFALGLSVLASLVPARKVAGIKPLEVLRKH
jgi:lipoprotein-releasing system permease protein